MEFFTNEIQDKWPCSAPAIKLNMTDIHTEEVSYSADGVEMKAYLAWDSTKGGPRPRVLVVQKWWGCNEYAKRRAHMLAGAGYTGLALDFHWLIIPSRMKFPGHISF